MPSKKSSDRKLVFVVGSDDYNLALVRKIPGSDQWDVRRALDHDDVVPPSGHIDFDALYQRACETIEAAEKPPDAVIGHLDFPVTSLVSLLNRRFGLTGASPEAVARCEHKYWLRMEQRKVFPKDTPDFRALNPFDRTASREKVPPYPFWLKPIKAHSSVLGFLVEKERDLDRALHQCRQRLHIFGEPFNHFLKHVEGTKELDGVDGNFVVAEELISQPRQFTIEAYMRRGKLTVYGTIESLRQGETGSSFSRYQYPADIPQKTVDRAAAIVEPIMQQIGYDNAPLNVEFFWNPESDALHLLEVNPRISKSHSPLFWMVDGASHHKVAIDLALGREPDMPKREGREAVAGKFMMRSFEADGIVRRVPNDEEISELKRILPDLDTHVLVETNARLSSLLYQDSYSYELAELFLGGDDTQVIEDAYTRCLDSLQFLIQPMPENA